MLPKPLLAAVFHVTSIAPSQAPLPCILNFLLIERLLRSSCGLRGPLGRSRLPSGHSCVWDSCSLHTGQGKGHSYLCLHWACQEVEASEDSGTRNLVAAGPGEDRYRKIEPGWQWVWEAASTDGAEGGGGWWTRLAFLHRDTQLAPLLWFIKISSFAPPMATSGPCTAAPILLSIGAPSSSRTL